MYYTAEEIVAKAKQAEGYEEIPNDYWLCFVRRNEEDRKPDTFNGRVYLMCGERLVMETTCTTVPGTKGLLNFQKYNKKGSAVLKSDIWLYDTFSPGLHKGKLEALRQVKKAYTYRDNDRDVVAEELGTPVKGLYYTNIHLSSYNIFSKVVKKFIGLWSVGCLVLNNPKDYREIIRSTKKQKYVTAIILKEFSI